MDSVGNRDRGSVDSVGNDGGSMDSVGNRDSLRGLGLTSVGDLSDVAINIVGVVVDSLDTAVRKVHLVGALNNTGTIVALGLAECSLGVVVGNPIVVGVGGDLGQITYSVDSNRGGVGNSVDHRGSMDSMSDGMGNHRGGMDSMVGNRVGKSVTSMGNWWSHVGSQGSNSSMSDRDWPVGSNGRLDLREALGVVGLSDWGVDWPPTATGWATA